MMFRKWEVVYDNPFERGVDAGKHLFFFKRSADSWARLTQRFTGKGMGIRWYTRRRDGMIHATIYPQSAIATLDLRTERNKELAAIDWLWNWPTPPKSVHAGNWRSDER